MENKSKFGLLFDIDGVLLRGKTPIPVAKEAIQMAVKVSLII
jgi:ribonucleotide monophosphatase NagD (HAD superfamily)